jgi:hypothetical protein
MGCDTVWQYKVLLFWRTLLPPYSPSDVCVLLSELPAVVTTDDFVGDYKNLPLEDTLSCFFQTSSLVAVSLL